MSKNKYLIDLYTNHYKTYGATPQGLGWGEKDRVALRYQILTSLWDLGNSTVLDVGCGFGDFYKFIVTQKTKHIQFTGIDINPAFITIAKERNPKGIFHVLDLAEDSSTDKYDYVFASGIFNDRIQNANNRIIKMLKAIDSHSKKGFAVNFLSSKVDYKLPHAHHTDPAWALGACYAFSNNIILRNDYMPFEFTIFVNKDEKFDKNLAVYKRFL
jgi:SAM-dependent methyltransferase